MMDVGCYGLKLQPQKSRYVNDVTFQHWAYTLLQIYTSMFEWEGLPPTIDERYMEYYTCWNGYTVYFTDEVMGRLCLPCAWGGALNVYGIPTVRRAYGSNGYNKELTALDSVIIFDNVNHISPMHTIYLYAQKLADLDRTLDVNVNAQKTPILITGPENKILTLKNVYKQYTGNEPAIFGYRGVMDGSEFNTLKTEAPFVAGEVQQLKEKLLNEVLAWMGSSGSSDKRERMISSEAAANLSYIRAQRNARLFPRQLAAKEISSVLGDKITVRFREEYWESVTAGVLEAASQENEPTEVKEEVEVKEDA